MEPRICKLEEKVNDMDKNLAVFQEILTKFDGTVNKLFSTLDGLNNTLNGINISMVGMQSEIKNNAEDIADIKSKVDTLDNNSKFNWQNFIVTKAIPYLLVAGAAVVITKLVIGG